MKKVISLIITIVLLASMSVPAVASTDIMQRPGGVVISDIAQDGSVDQRGRSGGLGGGVPSFDPGPPDFDPDMLEQLRLERLIEHGVSSRFIIPPSYSMLHRYALRMQERFNWCGPAAATMALEAHNGRYVTQRTFAREFGIENNNLGAYIHDMQRSLSNRGAWYIHMRADWMDVQTFEINITELLSRIRLIPILQVCVTGLPWIGGTQRSGHYVVVGAYSGFRWAGTAQLVVEDPHYNTRFFGSHHMSVSAARNAVNRHNGHILV